jgi:hypothetical protein
MRAFIAEEIESLYIVESIGDVDRLFILVCRPILHLGKGQNANCKLVSCSC